jgi:hypothetical protein
MENLQRPLKDQEYFLAHDDSIFRALTNYKIKLRFATSVFMKCSH